MTATPSTRRVRAACLVAAAVALAASVAGIGVRATYGAHVAVDETEYALTALSLWEDHDLDVADEFAQRRWREFSDVVPPVQTEQLADGRRLSPHDPLLPLLLAAPMGLFGWVGAKVALALLAAATAALTCWVAVRRFAVPPLLAGAGTALLAGTPPLAVYGQQLYPELPAALAVLVGVAALTAPRPAGRSDALLVAAVVALPWLGVKYLPVAAALAVLGLARAHRAGRRRVAVVVAGVLGACGVAYLLVHRAVWGGWTVYASGDHFQQTGEFSVVGVTPDYAGRTVRLVGLLADREFGLVAWAPAWLLLVPAAAWALRRRQWALLLPLAAAWATATWLALTMHGYWWPGRQVVVVLPLALVAVLGWLAALPAGRWRSGALAAAAGLAAAGATTYAWLLVEGWRGGLTWVYDFMTVGSPAYRWLRPLLPDYRGTDVLVPHLTWVAAVLGLTLLGWSTAGPDHGHHPDRAVPTYDEKETHRWLARQS